jgi:hypothetical protein
MQPRIRGVHHFGPVQDRKQHTVRVTLEQDMLKLFVLHGANTFFQE